MWRLIVSSILAAAASPAAGQTVSFSDVFTQTGRSLYASGPGVSIDTGTLRLGPDPWDIGKTVGGFVNPCDPLGNCPTGVQLGAETKGNLGLEYGVKLNSGSFDTIYPINVKIATSSPGGLITRSVATSFTTPGYTAPPLTTAYGMTTFAQLKTHTPTLQAFVDLKASFSAFAGAQACVFGVCQGPAITPYGPLATDQSQTLIAINRNNDGKIVVVGTPTQQLDKNFSALDGDLTVRLNLPNLDQSASSAKGSTATQLQTVARDNIVALDANVGNIVSKAIGLPLVGTYGPIGYNLLSVNAGLALDVRQTLTVAYTPMEHYHFTSPVDEVGGPNHITDLVVPLGQAFKITSSKFSVGVIPDTFLMASVTNQTDLLLTGDFSVQAGGFNVFGQQVGPLLDSGNLQAGILDIPVFTNSWTANYGDFTSAGFNLTAGSAYANLYAPSLLGEFVTTKHAGDGAPFNYVTNLATTPCPLDQVLSDVCYDRDGAVGRTAESLPNAADGTPIYYNFGDPFALGTNNTPTYPLSTDEGEEGLLSATGYAPNPSGGFPIPTGAPPPPGATVPEPSTWMLTIAGFGLVGAIRRRRVAPAIAA